MILYAELTCILSFQKKYCKATMSIETKERVWLDSFNGKRKALRPFVQIKNGQSEKHSNLYL